MKIRSFVANTLSVIAVIEALGFSTTVQAQTFSGNVDGKWGNPIRGSVNTNSVYLVEEFAGGNKFSWGNPGNFGTGANFLNFFAQDFTNVPSGSLFELAKLEYFNGSIWSGTGVDSIDLKLNLSVGTSNPGLTQTDPFPRNSQDFQNFTLNLGFKVQNTPNIFPNPEDNADSVMVTQDMNSVDFRIDDKEYKFEILGFREDNGRKKDTITALEGETVTTALYGKITKKPQIQRVPESGNILGVFLVGIYLILRYRQQPSPFKN